MIKRVFIVFLFLTYFSPAVLALRTETQPIIYNEYTPADIVFYSDPAKLWKDCKRKFEAIKNGFDEIDAIPYEQRTLENTLYRMDGLFAELDFPDIMILGYVSPNDELRNAALKCEEAVSEYLSAFSLRWGIYIALKEPHRKYAWRLTSYEQIFLDETIQDFEFQGIQLDARKKQNSRISMLKFPNWALNSAKISGKTVRAWRLPAKNWKGFPKRFWNVWTETRMVLTPWKRKTAVVRRCLILVYP